MNPIISIALPFIGMTILMQKIKTKNVKFFSKILAVTLFLGSSFTYFTNKDLLIECSIFNLSIAIAYLTIILKNKYVVNILSCLAVMPLFYISYINGLHYIYILSQAAFIVVLYYAINNLKNNIAIFALQMPLLLVAGLYLSNNMQLFLISSMLLFGSIRYFIESKTKQAPQFLSLAYILIIALLISGFNNVNFHSNIAVVFAGSTLAIVMYCVQILSKNKDNIITRLEKTNEVMLVVYLRIFAFNAILIALAYLFKLEFISIWYAVAFAATVLFTAIIYLLYLEHSAKAKYYKQ